jgi:hypothetical protein
VRPALALLGLVLAGAGCAASGSPAATPARTPARSELIRGILASTVQLRSEHESGVSRAASGVVVATSFAARRMWIATARHFLEPSRPQQLYVRLPGRTSLAPATIAFVSGDRDLAIIETEYADVAPARLKMAATLGDEILLVSFPWGQRFTVVRGVVSQIDAAPGELPVAGPPRMVSATVSYGSSGGGVFDAETGELVAIVESYRTAKVAIPEMKGRTLDVPVAGETTVIPAPLIAQFLVESGLNSYRPR